MKLGITKGKTSKLLQLFVRDSSKTDGSGLTGLVFNSAGLTAYYYREGAASATSITLQTMTVGTWATGGFKEVDATNMPGWYQFGIPDAALATGADSVDVHFKGATNMVALPLEIQLQNVDMYDGVRAGLTSLPNAAAGATNGIDCSVAFGGTASAGAGSTITLAGASATDNFYRGQTITLNGGTGAGQSRNILSYVGATKVATVDSPWITNPDATTVYQVTGRRGPALDTNLAVLVQSGTAANQISLASGLVTLAAVTHTGAVIPSVTTVTGNVNGSVASVTGAVGSVTGAVGSVTGAVGSVAAGGITTGSFAAGAIDSTIFAQSAANRVLTGATIAEHAQAQPPVNPTLVQAVMLPYMAFRNGRTTTATTDSLQNDAGTVICKAAVSDDGTTFTRAKTVTGP